MIETIVIDQAAAEQELAKFFALSQELNAPLTMFSDYVDKRWHELMEDAEVYEQFCLSACGKVLGHVPSGQSNPIVVVEWIEQYESRHGYLPHVWFANEAGEFQDDAYQDYVDSHTIVASWKCNPSTGSVASVGQ